ncbi:LEF-8 [Callinectes sapidus nudivirus]|nr:LEF-8 [Callinectes sapidus nudivirus]
MCPLSALTNILEYNHQFQDCIIFDCPCYKTEYKKIEDICIENKSYVACIIIKKTGYPSKILHLKLPIMFGSLIDYKIRGDSIDNYNQFGCLYMGGCTKQMYNFIANNLTPGHVYTNKKENIEIFKFSVEDGTYSLNLTYNPTVEDKLQVKIHDIKFEKTRRLKRSIDEMERNMSDHKFYEDSHSKSKRQKTKLQSNYERVKNEYDSMDVDVEDTSKSVDWITLVNNHVAKIINSETPVEFSEDEYVELFNAYISCAPKLDDLSNKTNRTTSYVLGRALSHTIEACINNDKDLRSINPRIQNMFISGNMYFTLTQPINNDNQNKVLVKGYKSIFQAIEAQKISIAACLSATTKRSVNDSIKNSKALLFSRDGYNFICAIDSREMKGAGENVMLSQLVIIPIGINIEELITFLTENREMLATQNSEHDKVYQCVINSFIHPYKISHSNLLKIKDVFPTISLMIFNNFLIITTTGYNQMKYSVKYECFISPYEYQHIWTDAFDDYHPHLALNNCALFLPETAHLGLPAKLTVANANIRGRCTEITNKMEMMLFLHTNGASNAAIIHKIEEGDETVTVSFDDIVNPKDHMIEIPIKLENPQLRYTKLGSLGFVKDDSEIPEYVKALHENFDPIEDLTEAYGMNLQNIILKPKETLANILKILYKLYKNDTRLEFIDIDTQELRETDNPLLSDDSNVHEQVIFDNKQHNLKCYIRSNDDILNDYRKKLNFTFDKNHPPHMYINVAFGDCFGGTNEDGIIIDKKLAEHGPKKLISQTLNITYKEDFVGKKQKHIIKYVKSGNIIGNEILFGIIDSTVKLSFNKTKTTIIRETFIPPSTYHYTVSVEFTAKFAKYISSTFMPKNNSINIHYSYTVPIGIGSKLSTGHGQKGIVCKIMDLSEIVGYTKDGEKIHPLMLLSPTSVLGRTMANQVMSMALQPNRAFTKDGILIAGHGVNVHNIDPSIKSRKSEVKNDLMTTENGCLSNNLAYTMKVLNDQNSCGDKDKFHVVRQIFNLQGVNIHFVGIDQSILTQSM